MIYGKYNKGGRFKPVDLEGGCLVTNVIHGSYFDSEEEAKGVINYLNNHNKNMVFTYKKKG